MGDLAPLDLLIIGTYLTALLWVGWRCSRRQDSTQEYFLAGRSMNPLIVGLSITASLLSSISYIAMPGEMVKNGPGYLWFLAAYPFTYVIVGYFIIPRIMKARVTSGYELLESRFGPHIRQTASAFFILMRFSWMGLIIFTCGTAVAAMTQVPAVWLFLVVGGVGTLYTVIGGFRAVMISDAIQFLILFGAGVLAIVHVTLAVGGVAQWWPTGAEMQTFYTDFPRIKIFSADPFERLTVVTILLNTILWYVCAATSDQVSIQHFLATRDARAARRSYLVNLVADCAITAVLFMIGLALLSYYTQHPEKLPAGGASVSSRADALFPHYIATALPAGLTGIIVAGLMAAAMSSLVTGISSICTVIMTDFPRVFARRLEQSDLLRLKRAKAISFALGALGILVSFFMAFVPGRNILEVAMKTTNFFAVPLFALFAMAFFMPFITRAGAWTAVIVGFFAGVLFAYWKQIVGPLMPTSDFSIMLIMFMTTLCTFAAGIGVSLFTSQSAPALAKSETTFS